MSAARSGFAVAGLVALAGLVQGAAAPPAPSLLKWLAVFEKKAPEGPADLKVIQDHTKFILKRAIPATVGLRIGASAGSGVIVSEDGIILTAAHVSGRPGQDVDVLMSDGKTVLKGKTLGRNTRIDAGMIKITKEGKYPFAEVGTSKGMKPGKWCIAVGHPRGYIPGRSPVVRVGRIVFANDFVVRSDCMLVGGDSGGPLFDFDGRVIAIHSRINGPLEMNDHVPVNTYKETWSRLVAGESWGRGPFGGDDPRPARPTAYMGVAFNPEKDDLVIDEVPDGTPAQKAGVKVGDVIVQIDGMKLMKRPALFDLMRKKKVGDVLTVVVERAGKPVTIKITLEARPKD